MTIITVLFFPCDEGDNIGNNRNFRQFHQNNHNPEQNFQKPFRSNDNLAMSNINIVSSHTTGVLHLRKSNPNSQFISSKTLVKN